MTLISVLASVRFVTSGIDAVAPDLQSKITSAITALYASPTARAILETAARDGKLYFAGNVNNDTAYYPTPGFVNISAPGNDNTAWFNSNGTLVKGAFELILIHELKHATSPDNAPDPGFGQAISNTLVNEAGWITDGPAVRAQNAVARELNQPDQVRVSYLASFDIRRPDFKPELGQSYTDGAVIDSARIGVIEFGGNIDESAHATKLRNLIFGTGSADTINAAAGNDFVYGGAGNDTIRGGSGYDVIYGDDRFDFSQIGNDWLYGDGGNDRIYGGKGTDHLYGGTGIDILVGGAGGDFIYGEVGNDVISGDFGINDDATVEDGVDYADTIDAGAGNDTINGQAGDDILTGGANNDTIYGGIGNDSLNGGTGLDILWGDEGDDVLGGGDGDDILYAGPGTDSLVGGKGNDIIDLSRGAENATILYIKSDGLDTVRGPTGSNITLSFIDLAANQLNFEFRYTGVVYTLDSGEISTGEPAPRYYDFATYQGDLHITSKLSALAGLVLEGASVIYKQYPYYQEYLHPGLQKITFATAPTIVTASGAIIFGLGIGDPDIDISFVEVVTLPDAARSAAFAWGERPYLDYAATDVRRYSVFGNEFESGAQAASLADYAFA